VKARDVESEEEERFDTGCVKMNVTRLSLFCVSIVKLPIPVAVRSKVWAARLLGLRVRISPGA
jgi:hypothetical protein